MKLLKIALPILLVAALVAVGVWFWPQAKEMAQKAQTE